MLTKDYLMRMIDTLVRVLARLVFLKNSKDYTKAFSELNNVAKEFFALDLNFAETISNRQLVELIGKNKLLLPGNCYVFGILFQEEAELFELQNDFPRAGGLYEKSLSLFTEGLKSSPSILQSDHLDKINSVVEKLNEFEINIETEENIFFFYEFTGNYAEAENVIYNLIEFDKSYIKSGIEFCMRLLEKSDEELIRGNLPRHEVEESLAGLKKKII